uniref:Uncharacterized protein n=1 Tax=Rhizophora mucronata TaxID=61149 RepID=A0A2P2MQ16_RHIMU
MKDIKTKQKNKKKILKNYRAVRGKEQGKRRNRELNPSLPLKDPEKRRSSAFPWANEQFWR